ncbi:MAG: hypothetical protein WD208_08035 [Dehalococcoidia bacterium]
MIASSGHRTSAEGGAAHRSKISDGLLLASTIGVLAADVILMVWLIGAFTFQPHFSFAEIWHISALLLVILALGTGAGLGIMVSLGTGGGTGASWRPFASASARMAMLGLAFLGPWAWAPAWLWEAFGVGLMGMTMLSLIPTTVLLFILSLVHLFRPRSIPKDRTA